MTEKRPMHSLCMSALSVYEQRGDHAPREQVFSE